jgi:hypothetical protein
MLSIVLTIVFGILTIVFGVLNVWQLFLYFVDRKARDANKRHLRATKVSLQAVRAMCTEAIERGEVIKSEAEKQYVRQIAWTIRGIEEHIDAILEIEPPDETQMVPGPENKADQKANAAPS